MQANRKDLFVGADVAIVLMAPQARLLLRAQFTEQVGVNIVLLSPCKRVCIARATLFFELYVRSTAI